MLGHWWCLLVRISGFTSIEYTLGSLSAVIPTCQAIDQLNGACYSILGQLCVDVKIGCQQSSQVS